MPFARLYSRRYRKCACIRKTIFTAPPPDADVEEKIKRWRVRYGTQFTTKGTSYLERKDGSTTIVPREYWTSLHSLDVQQLYNTLATSTKLVVIMATADEVLGEVVLDKLVPRIKIIKMTADHNFEGGARKELVDAIADEIGMTKPRIVVVNDQDEIIGHKERGTLVKEDIYRVSGLWITNSKGDILLAQRKFTKTHDPGKWGPAVAGTVDEGETYGSNIVKEAEEEIGLINIQPTKGPNLRVSEEYNYFCQWYTLVVDKPASDFTIQEDEVEQVKWFTCTELKKELHEHPEKYLASLGWSLENL